MITDTTIPTESLLRSRFEKNTGQILEILLQLHKPLNAVSLLYGQGASNHAERNRKGKVISSTGLDNEFSLINQWRIATMDLYSESSASSSFC